MDLLTLLAGIGAIVLFLVVYRACVDALNIRSEAKYGYRPVSISMCLLATVPYLIILTGALMGGDNLTVGLLAAFVVLAIIFTKIALKSSLVTALLSLPLLAIAGLGVIFIVLLLYLIFGQKKEPQPKSEHS